MIVSHDRDFLDPIVNKVLEVQPETTGTFLGNVSYYLQKVSEREQRARDESEAKHLESEGKSELSRKEQRRLEAEQRQRKYKRLKPLKKRLNPLEQQIEKSEARQHEIEAQMAEPDFYDDAERVKNITLEYEKLKAELVEKYAEWEELAHKVSRIEEEFGNA
jgi:ATP-binding cassette subfamily F protein 3